MNFNNINYLYRKFKVTQLLFIRVGVGVVGTLRKTSSPLTSFFLNSDEILSDNSQVLISLKSDNPLCSFLLIIKNLMSQYFIFKENIIPYEIYRTSSPAYDIK